MIKANKWWTWIFVFVFVGCGREINIPGNFYSGGPHSFQVEMFFSGVITITNLEHVGVDGLVGVCSGGFSQGPQQVDFYDSIPNEPMPGFFELFQSQQGDPFDLHSRLLAFTPNETVPEGYEFTQSGTPTTFPFTPGTGTTSSESLIFSSGDTSRQITFTEPNTVTYFGEVYGQIFLGTNGYLAFGQGDSTWQPDISNHFNLPRLSGLYSDWEPQNGGEIWVDEFDLGGVGYIFVVTFIDVPHFNSPQPTASFQISIREDGLIRYYYDEVNSSSGLVGLSAGVSGIQPQETNYLP